LWITTVDIATLGEYKGIALVSSDKRTERDRMTYTDERFPGVTFRIEAEQDSEQVRGNALASGDKDEDRACEDEIIERLDNGDVWAWASVAVRASLDITDPEDEGAVIEFEGTDYLGACSYADEADFAQQGGYFDDMKSQAVDDLRAAMRDAVERGAVARIALDAVPTDAMTSPIASPDLTSCRYCERAIVNEDGAWIDPMATGDDSVWRETCDAHDTFEADHEPTDA